ncbi:hypothetical protein C0993_004211, partial [Termitomyces sp. T159_Od127]
NEQNKIRIQQLTFQTQLCDPEFTFRSLGFTLFLSTWVIRQVDPKKTHPNPLAEIPLPEEVPLSFRVLPEYIIEDIVEYFLFVVQCVFAPSPLLLDVNASPKERPRTSLR